MKTPIEAITIQSTSSISHESYLKRTKARQDIRADNIHMVITARDRDTPDLIIR